MPSPLCTVKDGSGAIQTTPPVATVTPSNSVEIVLADATGVSTWSITCIYTDETTTPAAINALLTVLGPSKTAIFTAPQAGTAMIFQSVINGGLNANGATDPSLTCTFKISTLTAYGTHVVAANETSEHGSSGWLPVLNNASRGAAFTGALSFFPSFYKSSPDGSALIYRRGDSISTPTFQARYVGTIPTSATLSTASFACSSTPTAPTPSTPFESFAFSGSLSATGSDGVNDPSYTVTLNATYNPGKSNVDPSLSVTKTLSQTIYFASDVYFGYSSGTSITATNVYSGSLMTGFTDRLQRASAGTFSVTTPGTAQYLYFLVPTSSQYTSFPAFAHATIANLSWTSHLPITITRNGVTRTYNVWRTSSTVATNTTHTVTVS